MCCWRSWKGPSRLAIFELLFDAFYPFNLRAFACELMRFRVFGSLNLSMTVVGGSGAELIWVFSPQSARVRLRGSSLSSRANRYDWLEPIALYISNTLQCADVTSEKSGEGGGQPAPAAGLRRAGELVVISEAISSGVFLLIACLSDGHLVVQAYRRAFGITGGEYLKSPDVPGSLVSLLHSRSKRNNWREPTAFTLRINNAL